LQATLDSIEAGCKHLTQELDQLAASVKDAAEDDFIGSLNAVVPLHLKGGQVELRDEILPDYSSAVLLPVQRVTCLNNAIVAEAGELVSLLQAQRAQKQQLHATEWQLQHYDLAMKHKVEETRELQMLRVSGNVLAMLTGASVRAHQHSSKDTNEVLLQHARQQHVRPCSLQTAYIWCVGV
jgi:hypothetical protein